MLVWLLTRFGPLFDRLSGLDAGDSRIFLTGRIAAAALLSFVLAVALGPRAIDWLRGRFRERIGSASARLNELHAAKERTPTMGGLFIVAAVVCSSLFFGDLSNRFVQLAVLTCLGFGALGAVDDWVKIRSSRNGLTARQKFAVQVVLAAAISAGLHGGSGGTTVLVAVASLAWSSFVIVGTSNGVNLTDGLDGLAAGCCLFACGAFAAVCYLSGHAVLADYLAITHVPGAGELAVVLGSLVGAMLGFLWFNAYPAQVFMGDTGSLPTGAVLALAALATRQELLLVVVGGIFVAETLSVFAQVACFKLTGRRLIACSPLHNHFLFEGMPETRIVVRFWIVAALLAFAAVASLKIG